MDYYVSRRGDLLGDFDAEALVVRRALSRRQGSVAADDTLCEARRAFEALILQIPYIGGDDNCYTSELIRSARCLALYRAMEAHGRCAADAGRVLWDASARVASQARSNSGREAQVTRDELMRRRLARAERSQRRQYSEDYVFTLVVGDGEAFDYGYDFAECATFKFYHAQGAEAFLPFFCFLDFAASRVAGLGLARTMTLSEGDPICDHRFKRGRATEPSWPPPFLRKER